MCWISALLGLHFSHTTDGFSISPLLPPVRVALFRLSLLHGVSRLVSSRLFWVDGNQTRQK